jgi:general secretion pathway protein H
MRASEAGFTLVELMVVLVIVGLISGAALLAMPDPDGSLAREAERLAARARTAQESAIVDNGPVAIRLSPTGYGFERREAAGWAAVDDRALAPVAWSAGTTMSLRGPGDRIVFDPVGLSDAAELRLARGDDRIGIAFSETGEIHVQR